MLMYIPLIKGVITNQIKQPFAMWLLWTLLDGTTLISVLAQGGNWPILAFYTTMSILITSILLFKKQYGWGKFETLIASLVISCMLIWAISGPKIATIVGTIAIVIATFPMFRDAWKDPKSNPWKIWLGFSLANGLSTAAGTMWSIEERFYSTSCAILCILIAGVNLIRK